MDEENFDIKESFMQQAFAHAIGGDLSWLDPMDELVRLYDEREEHANNWWTTPVGSAERAEWEEHNKPYLAALHAWEEAWKLVVGNHARHNMITYEMATDTVALRKLKL
jgi:hypothetical protein